MIVSIAACLFLTRSNALLNVSIIPADTLRITCSRSLCTSPDFVSIPITIPVAPAALADMMSLSITYCRVVSSNSSCSNSSSSSSSSSSSGSGGSDGDSSRDGGGSDSNSDSNSGSGSVTK